MTKLKHGSLFSGYGGLDLAVNEFFNTQTAWMSEVSPAATKVLAQRFPDVPNLGDITQVDWTQAHPVDVISGGSPCQDLSTSGFRKGMKPGTRSGLWDSMMDAVDTLKPTYVVWENVLGALSAPTGVPHIKALGKVLYDLSCAGYDASWRTVGAYEVGAPHRRLRVFVGATKVAGPRDIDPVEFSAPKWASNGSVVEGAVTDSFTSPKGSTPLLPTPVASDWRSNNYPADLRRKSPRLTAWSAHFPNPEIKSFLGANPPAATRVSPQGKEEFDPVYAEWMMGLPKGWVTDILHTRKDVHEILGNGVVPAQAVHALGKIFQV